MLPFADGSDLAASLRNPGNFCNVVGFRPAPGRVPNWPAVNGWQTLSTLGPIGRTVEDTAFLLSAMAGPDPRSPVSIAEPGSVFDRSLKRSFKKVRVAWSRDLGGLPIDPRVTAVIEAQRATFQALGCDVEDGQPDFSDAREIFQVWRGWQFESRYAPLLEHHRHQLKDTIIWNLEQGQKITGPQLAAAERKRTALYHRVREFIA